MTWCPKDRLPDFKVDDLSRRYDELVARAVNVHPARRGKQAPARNAALRLQTAYVRET
jgi:hypothetical protein